MSSLSASVGHNLRRLPDFSGRETRALFWPYVLLLFVVAMIVDVVLMMLPLFDSLLRTQRYLVEHPEAWPPIDDATGQPKLPADLMPDFAGVMVPIAIVNLVFTLLVAAAVARRLHDRDRTGLWGLLPAPFIAAGYALAPRIFADMTRSPYPDPDPVLMAMVSLISALQWAALIALILLLAQEGTEGPNRYGPPPPP